MVPAIDFDILAAQMLPSAQRLPQWITFARVLLSQNKRLGDLFVRYMNGSDDLNYWSGAVAYSKGDLVKDLYGVFESKTDANTGNALSDSTNWLKVLDSFIGANERVKYKANYLTLTYALNRLFGTTFRQPPYPAPYGGSGTFSDIYITRYVPPILSLIGFPTLEPEDTMYPAGGRYFGLPTLVTSTSTLYMFAINVPTFVYASLGAEAEAVIRSFANKYVPVGILYNIVLY